MTLRPSLVLCIPGLLLASCSLFGGSPEPEPPVALEDSYLQGGPNTEVELGSGERTLLEDYRRLDQTRLELETRVGELRAENKELRDLLAETEGERDHERQVRVGSEQEFERIASKARGYQAKLLSMSIHKSRLEQEVLRLRISMLERQLDSITVSPEETASPAPLGSKR